MSARLSDSVVRSALTCELDRLLPTCSPAQRMFFQKIYPKVSALTEEKLRSALDLVQRTVRKNEADPSRINPEPDEGTEP
jgi:hypothetical protein